MSNKPVYDPTLMDREGVRKACDMALDLAEHAKEHNIDRAIFGDVCILNSFERHVISNIRAGKRPTGTC